MDNSSNNLIFTFIFFVGIIIIIIALLNSSEEKQKKWINEADKRKSDSIKAGIRKSKIFGTKKK